ncbi:SDR family NAD(P)-dependent oxidoreductase [Glaciecola sp. 1036]|uniref:SDR family NAD(P)-dependent oxidoreductase n=1 Tax=Alteromonadaceae TaxID=72275 RepID=UPI003D063243
MSQIASYPSLNNKTVFITGGGTGIGAVMVERFCQQGAKVAFVDLVVDKSLALCSTLKGQYQHDPLFLECDIRDASALKESINTFQQKLGDISVLINNAADDTRHQADTLSEDAWDNYMAINLRPCFFATQEIIPQMQRLGGGSIINMGSVSWRKKQTCMPAYTTAKAAIEGLSRTMAATYGKDNVRVNTLIPGWVMTERQMTRWLNPDIVQEVQESQCIKKTLQPDDIANAALFLASEDSNMLTGQSIIVDAGWA